MKKLIIFFDGTSNKFGTKNTNVVKAFRVIDDQDQLKCYIPGVGSIMDKKDHFFIKRLVKKWMGKGFGYGLQERVLAGYKFLCRHYVPGDEISMFGYSRGAYSAKVLAALVSEYGLMGTHNDYNMQYAYNLYIKRKPNFETMAKFKKTFATHRPSIKFLGLWDSVSSVGNAVQMRNYPYTSNVKNVEYLRHAIAVDERRFMFVNNTSNSNGDNVQMWFPGVHSDVGGGQKEEVSHLSKIALKWMLDEAKQIADLSYNKDSYKRYVMGSKDGKYVGPDHLGDMHNKLSLIHLLNFFPRFRVTKYKPTKEHKVLWPLMKYRKIEDHHQVHPSVFDRMRDDKSYKPKNVLRWKDERDKENQKENKA